MAGGPYFNAKNGDMLLASKHFCRSAGVVASMDGGPSRPEEHTQTSRLHWGRGQYPVDDESAWKVGDLPSPCIQDIVNETQRRFLVGKIVWIADDFGVGVLFVDFIDELGEVFAG